MEGTNRRWLCVAYAFPPINRSGTHRTAAFVRHLARQGWDADVITVQPEGESVDPELLATVPEATWVRRTRCVDLVAAAKRPFGIQFSSKNPKLRPATGAEPVGHERLGLHGWCSRLLQTPDSRLGWVPSAVAAGTRRIRANRPDALYSTSPYASAHLIALMLHRLHRIPWVADFRDPWVGNPYAEAASCGLTQWNALLERAVVRAASAVVCNTRTLRESTIRRHPVAEEKCHTIPNGVDLDLFVDRAEVRTAPQDTFTLLHAGQFYGPRTPTVLFEALRRAAKRLPASRKIQLALLGSELYEGRPLQELAASAGAGDYAKVLGKRTHGQALAYLVGADALVVMGSSGPGAELQVPNKLFEYLGARKPILAVVPANSPTIDILRQSRAEAVVCDPADADSLASAIVNLACGTYDCPAEPWSGVARFDRAHRATELRALFESLVLRSQTRSQPRLYPSTPIATMSRSMGAYSCE